MWILLAVIIIAAGIFTVPSIIASFRNIIHESSQNQESSSEYAGQELPDGDRPDRLQKPLCRYNGEERTIYIELLDLEEAEEKRVRASASAGDRIDHALLALAHGPDPEELSGGYFSAIPAGTEYIGSRLIRDALYIAFSESFIENQPLGEFGVKLAGMQTMQAVAGFPSIQRIIILVNDEAVFGPASVSGRSTRIILPPALTPADSETTPDTAPGSAPDTAPGSAQ